jgi:hypothetical protein
MISVKKEIAEILGFGTTSVNALHVDKHNWEIYFEKQVNK